MFRVSSLIGAVSDSVVRGDFTTMKSIDVDCVLGEMKKSEKTGIIPRSACICLLGLPGWSDGEEFYHFFGAGRGWSFFVATHGE